MTMTVLRATASLESGAAFVAGQLAAQPLYFEPARLHGEMNRLARHMAECPRPTASTSDLSEFGALKRSAQVARLATAIEAEPVEVGDGMGWYALTRDGIAVVSVCGPLLNRSDWWTRWLDLPTYDTLPMVYEAAATDPRVKAILTDADTPGGVAAGMLDCADRIAEVKGSVPLWAVANPLAASAGYGIACVADKLLVPRMAAVGSVGVVMFHLDVSGMDEQWGLKYTAIYAGARKVDGWSHAPLTEDALSNFQTEIDEARLKFAAHVSKYRKNMTVEAVMATEAACLEDGKAVAAGLADEVGSFDQALSMLRASLGLPAAPRASLARSTSATTGEPKMATEKPDGPEASGKSAFATCEGCSNPGECESAGTCDKEKDMSAANAETARQEGYDAALAYVAEVNDLCALAGQPSKAGEFIKAKTPVADVRAALLNARAEEADKTAITSHPETLPAGKSGALIAAAKATYGQKGA